MNKKEAKEQINERSKKHRTVKTTKKIEIVGLNQEDVDIFKSLVGLENLSHAEKLRILMNFWNEKKNPNSENLEEKIIEKNESQVNKKEKKRVSIVAWFKSNIVKKSLNI